MSAPTFEKDSVETLDYTADFERHCALLREPNTTYSNGAKVRPARASGYQYTTTGGTSGTDEPRWPVTAGGTVTDGSVTWTAEALSASSFQRTIASASWTADTGITVTPQSPTASKATCLIAGGTLGQTYAVRCDGVFTDGTTKSAHFYVRIVRPRVVDAQ